MIVDCFSIVVYCLSVLFFFSSRRRHTRCALVTGVQTCALPICGSQHLLRPPARFEAHSPFNYAAQAEVLIVTDIKKGDIAAMSGAYARLIEAAQGGTLGLFTAIRRLRAVHARIADRKSTRLNSSH